jgi:hypothetical protein
MDAAKIASNHEETTMSELPQTAKNEPTVEVTVKHLSALRKAVVWRRVKKPTN